MSREVRGILMGLCIVLLSVAAYFLREKPPRAPTGTETTAPRAPS